MTPLPSDPPPSRVRYGVLGFLCSLTFILYLDRVCIQQALKPIQKDLDLTETELSYVLMAFTLAYGLFEMPTGHWGDRKGSRSVLTRIAGCWSVFTALTAACVGLPSLLVVRFLFGAAEAGALPNVARVVARWFPKSDRGRITGLVQTSMLLGASTAPVVAAYIIRIFGWRWAFILFGQVGVVWAIFFWLWFRDDPAQHPSVNPGELKLLEGTPDEAGHTHHESIPWAAVLRNPSVWLLGTIMILAAFNSYVYLFWFSKYLTSGRGVGDLEAGWLSTMVLTGSMFGMLAGGFLADLVAPGGVPRPWGRRLVGSAGYLLAAIFLGLGLSVDSPRVMALFAMLSIFCSTATLSTWWGCVAEISGRHLGALFGLVNGMGVIGAMGSQYLMGRLADWRGSQGYTGRAQWDLTFYLCLVVLTGAASCWALFTPHAVKAGEPETQRG